jgi:hypothetical protein
MKPFDAAEIARILEQGSEGRTIEFKEGIAADGRVARTICAFANTRGGVLLVGVSDRRAPLGVPRPAAAAEAVRALARDAIEPPVAVVVETVRLPSVSIVCCSVPWSPARPHAVRRSAGAPEVLIRVGSSNRLATDAAVAAMGTPSSRAVGASALDAAILREAARAGGAGVAVEPFAASAGVGKQRARQAFERLERAGRLVAHGLGPRRTWYVPRSVS